jgi:hypothetical protein
LTCVALGRESQVTSKRRTAPDDMRGGEGTRAHWRQTVAQNEQTKRRAPDASQREVQLICSDAHSARDSDGQEKNTTRSTLARRSLQTANERQYRYVLEKSGQRISRPERRRWGGRRSVKLDASRAGCCAGMSDLEGQMRNTDGDFWCCTVRSACTGRARPR